MTEHGVLKRLLLAYRAASAAIVAGGPPPADAITEAAQVISDFVESFHEGLEEAYVFPRLQRAGRNLDVVQTLLVQHDRGRHITAAVLTAAGSDLSTAHQRDSLRQLLDQFVRMYEPHEAWEDTVIYPSLREITDQRTLDLLAERFADEQDKQFGDSALDQVLDRVAGIEQRLGIANLADFTPTPLGPPR